MSSVNPPCTSISVTPTVACLPVRPASPAGLKNIAVPSGHGSATPVPPRPMAHAPCSKMPKPCPARRVGIPAHSHSAYPRDRRIRLSPDRFWRGGGTGSPTVALARTLAKPMRDNVSALFRTTFGVAPEATASAPGRVNLLGEHTDYNGGPVLPVAIAERTVVAVGRAYAAGVMHELVAAGAAPAGAGARVAVASDVPVGAGLASSAALTVALAKALSLLARARLTPRQIAGVAFRAEYHHVGVRCGIMDQMSAALAKPGHALLLDCASLATRHIPLR